MTVSSLQSEELRGLSESEMTDSYRGMVTIRKFELLASRLADLGHFPGTLHSSVGQEAVAVGVCAALTREDYITSTHRGHAHCLAKGAEPAGMMAELYARREGYCGGRSGSMHIADAAVGNLGANAIVGAGMPIALGAAFSAKCRDSGQVAVTFFGDGAVAEGVFHESLNIAALWKLPIVFVCENNGYAELTPTSVHLAAQDVSSFAAAYGIPGHTVDGNDVGAVTRSAAEAVARAREGGGPTLLEFKTYRWFGHFHGDPARYRDPAEVASWKENDPLQRLLGEMESRGLQDVAARIDEEVSALLDAAVEEAQAGTPVDTDCLTTDVYRDPSAFVRNYADEVWS